MCCTGQCPYEDRAGDCALGFRRVYPEDAACVQEDAEDAEHEE